MSILVIDVGSSSIRTLLFDDEASLLPGGVVSRAHHFTVTPAGASIADAELLCRAVEDCIDAALQHPAAGTLRGVGMATFAGNLLGIDMAGQAVTPLYTYADTRCSAEVALLRQHVDPEWLYQRTGCPLHSAYHPARLAWLRRGEPALFGKVLRWLDFATYLYFRWFGRSPCSYSMASWSGLLDRARLSWDAAWLQTLELDHDALPVLADYDALQSGLLRPYAARWPALHSLPFCLAVGDGAAANVGLGAMDSSKVGLTVGTTAALRLVTAASLPAVPEGLWSYRVDAEHHLIGGATSEGGNVFDWLRRELLLPDDAALEVALSERPRAGHGLAFLPLLAGERSPGWAADASAAIAGLQLSTDAIDIVQAGLEGVALRLSLVFEQLSTEASTVMAGGGALARSPAWAQMIADALNRPLELVAGNESTARGVAIMVLRALGMADLDTFSPQLARTVEPQQQGVEALAAARERQIALYDNLPGSSAG